MSTCNCSTCDAIRHARYVMWVGWWAEAWATIGWVVRAQELQIQVHGYAGELEETQAQLSNCFDTGAGK